VKTGLQKKKSSWVPLSEVHPRNSSRHMRCRKREATQTVAPDVWTIRSTRREKEFIGEYSGVQKKNQEFIQPLGVTSEKLPTQACAKGKNALIKEQIEPTGSRTLPLVA